MFRDGFLAIQAAKMAAIWRIFAGQWIFTPLERIERVSVCFNGVFYFALRRFSWNGIIVVKRGTTVYRRGKGVSERERQKSSTFKHHWHTPPSLLACSFPPTDAPRKTGSPSMDRHHMTLKSRYHRFVLTCHGR